MNEAQKRWGALGVKLAFSLGALFFVFSNVDVGKIGDYLSAMDWRWVAAALLILNLGQVMSALRLRYYFASAGVRFRRFFSIALYYTGMFFNRLLPGGIGGDGYNSYVLKRYKEIPLRTSIRLMLCSRANGLLILLLIVFSLMSFMQAGEGKLSFSGLHIVLAALVVTASYSIFTRVLLKETWRTQIGAARYSMVVQVTVLLASFFLFSSVDNASGPMLGYLLLFMVSSIMTMIPISVGGAGLRELTFFYGAGLVGVNAELGITVSVVYFLLDLISSLAGLIFWHRLEKIEAFEKS